MVFVDQCTGAPKKEAAHALAAAMLAVWGKQATMARNEVLSPGLSCFLFHNYEIYSSLSQLWMPTFSGVNPGWPPPSHLPFSRLPLTASLPFSIQVLRSGRLLDGENPGGHSGGGQQRLSFWHQRLRHLGGSSAIFVGDV